MMYIGPDSRSPWYYMVFCMEILFLKDSEQGVSSSGSCITPKEATID